VFVSVVVVLMEIFKWVISVKTVLMRIDKAVTTRNCCDDNCACLFPLLFNEWIDKGGFLSC
jgi:hypothetical protein